MMRAKGGVSLLACVLFSSLLSGLWAEDRSGLAWKMAMLQWDGADYVAIPFKRPLKMKAGDSFQVSLQPEAECRCYAIAKDEGGNLETVFDGSIKKGQTVFLPDPDNDFAVTQEPGSIKKLYVILSTRPQSRLEALLARGKSVAAGNAAAALEDEILKLKDQAASLGEEPEKPVAMGGVTRAPNAKASDGTRFGGLDTYVKTISVDR